MDFVTPQQAQPAVCCWMFLPGQLSGVVCFSGLVTSSHGMCGARAKKKALTQRKGHMGTPASADRGAPQLQGYLAFCGRRGHSSQKNA